MLKSIYRRLVAAAAVVSGLLLVYMGLATALGVFARYVLRTPSRFLFESTEMAIAICVFLVLAYTALKGRHVRVEVIPDRFAKTNLALDKWSDRVTALLSFVFAAFVFTQFYNDLASGIRIGSTTGLPRWVPMLTFFIGLVLYGIFQLRWVKPEIETDIEASVAENQTEADKS
ncbi:TRAP transporter small permease [Salinibacterium sp. M195]|uniref:TRAP transporter small permease n=1 Tax=Salinibacterium sp. M195 TaxID=2583374 RepID=UPI001C632AE7|nr:TRAP transporter small permease [Salinibacterium sp. M195]QYH35460.1 TRAP transporter small permease [Salinibacterium sp. M195]